MSDTAAESRAPKVAPKRALFFIMAVIFLDTVGFGIIAPVLPQLIANLNGSSISEAARIGGWLMVSYALVQFIFAPIIGNLSDRFGRRPVLLFSLLAFGIDYIFMGFAPTLFWLFVGRIIAGIAGGSYVTANAYIADISDDDVKARNFGYIGAAWGLGFIVGPMIGGILGGEIGVRAPFFAAAGLVFATLIFGFFVVPESLPQKDRRAFSWGRANTFGALLQIRHYPIVVGLLIAMFFYMIAHDANPSVWSYYTIEKFDWSPQMIGYSLGVVGICSVIINAGLVGPAVKYLGEANTALLGLALAATGFFIAGTAINGTVMMLAIFPICMMGLAGPAMRAIMSNAVPENAQGELQGATAAMMSLTMIIAPFIMTQLFAYYTAPGAPIYFPGVSYVLASVLMVVTFILCALLFRRVRAAA